MKARSDIKPLDGGKLCFLNCPFHMDQSKLQNIIKSEIARLATNADERNSLPRSIMWFKFLGDKGIAFMMMSTLAGAQRVKQILHSNLFIQGLSIKIEFAKDRGPNISTSAEIKGKSDTREPKNVQSNRPNPPASPQSGSASLPSSPSPVGPLPSTSSHRSPLPPSPSFSPPTPPTSLPPPTLTTTQTPSPNHCTLTEFCRMCRIHEGNLCLVSPTPSSPKPLTLSRGLVNNGNTCYRNAVLQGLLSLPPFVHLLLALNKSFTVHGVPSTLSSWREIMALVRCVEIPDVSVPSNSSTSTVATTSTSTTTPSTSTLAPINLTEVMPSLCRFRRDTSSSTASPQASAGTQEDAMEFLSFALDSLHQELVGVDHDGIAGNALKGISMVSEGWNDVKPGGVKGVLDSNSLIAAAKANDSTSICRLFFSRIRKEVTYAAKKKCSITYSPESCMSLEIADHVYASADGVFKTHGSGVVSLVSCINRYFSIDSLGTGTRRDEIQVTLDDLPPCLLLQLKRFSYDRQHGRSVKIMREVSYPMVLCLGADVCSSDLIERLGTQPTQSSAPVPMYSLHSIVLHHGASTTGGHYTAFAIGSDGMWRHFDDTRITVVDEAAVLAATKETYLLYYVRTHT